MTEHNYNLIDNDIIKELLYIFAELIKEQASNKTMLYQLASGRTIEISVEQYLDMSDEELNDLEGLNFNNTMEINNPFYNAYKGNGRAPAKPKEQNDEHDLHDIPTKVKLEDKFFHNKDEE